MTILPTKRAVNNNANDESNDNNGANNTKDRSSRHREEHNVVTENPPGSARRQFTYGNSGERKDLQKLYKENSISNVREQRERERQKQRELRRERKRDRQSKRTVKNDNNEPGDSSAAGDNVDAEQSNVSAEKKDSSYVDEDGSGCNSEDEYDSRRPLTIGSPTAEEWARRDAYFSRCLLKLGFEIKKMHEDGACLFRAIADQVYGDQELHSTVRSQCMDYIVQNQDFFAPYVTEDFDKYVERKRRWYVHGNHLEIQALSEMYNRTIEVYCYHTEPINIFNASSMNSYEPIRVSYHRMCHYNSITNPKKPSVLVGLGLPNYCTRCDLDRRDVHDAVRQSEDMLIEQVTAH
uniref:ubiquitinyl hydrolase 1 n=1 Tax=Photinus pyralis TaxID=7054 RepID=A0A1Y1NBK8_PHOPY